LAGYSMESKKPFKKQNILAKHLSQKSWNHHLDNAYLLTLNITQDDFQILP
jgi:hypothetical protein